MEVNGRAMVSARRCWLAALEQMEVGDFKAAGALIGAVGRYVEQIHGIEGTTFGEVIAFPLANENEASEALVIARSPLARDLEWGSSGCARD